MSDPKPPFEDAFYGCYDAVHRYAARRVASEAVQDVVAETFLVAWRHYDELRGEPLPWLLGIARRVAANQLRAGARREALHARLSTEPRPALGADPAQSDSQLAAALAALGERDREALMLVRPWQLCPGGLEQDEHSPGSGICEQSHERDLYYGLLGPDARSITYTSEGHSITQPTSGSEGAYLLVTHAIHNRFYDFQDASTGGVVPVSSPITAVHYRDGRTCHLTARSWIGGVDACTPSLPEPVGYVSPTGPPLTHVQVATPVHLRLVHRRFGGYEMLISFKSRVAVANHRRRYQIEWHEPGMPPQVNAFGSTEGDLSAGQTVTERYGLGRRGGLKPGITRGKVSLMQSTGGEEKEEPGVLVGRFVVGVP